MTVLGVRRLAAAVGVVVALAAGSILAGAGPAAAHVSVDAGTARQGAADAVLTFRVPNERAGATTVELAIKFPTLTPLGSVKPAPKTGWSVTTKRVKLESPVVTVDGAITEAVGEVVYRAASPATGIPEGGFDSFQILVGPLPTGVGTLSFPTVQTYSNGQVSSWIQPSVPGSEPANPAPVLALPPADDLGAGGGSPPGQAGTSTAGTSSVNPGAVRTAKALGVVGVVTGSLGMLAAWIAIGRSRRPADGGRR